MGLQELRQKRVSDSSGKQKWRLKPTASRAIGVGRSEWSQLQLEVSRLDIAESFSASAPKRETWRTKQQVPVVLCVCVFFLVRIRSTKSTILRTLSSGSTPGWMS